MKSSTNIIWTFTTVSILFYGQLCAQQFETRDKIKLRIKTTVEIVDSHKDRYVYEVGSSNQSTQKVWNFYIINGVHRDDIQKVEYPVKWEFGLPDNTPTAQVRWLTVGGEIPPGVTLAGFKFESKGLPGIVNYYAEGYAPPPVWPESVEEDSISGYDDLTPYGPGVVGKTIGPVLPPEPFIAFNFLDTLLSYTRQSVTLGWLKGKRDDDREDDEHSDDGIVKNIEKRIEKAKKELIKGDSAKARQELEKLVKKVEKLYKHTEEAEKEKHGNEIAMTGEAYALLKYNTEYLIGRLPKKKDKEGKEKED